MNAAAIPIFFEGCGGGGGREGQEQGWKEGRGGYSEEFCLLHSLGPSI